MIKINKFNRYFLFVIGLINFSFLYSQELLKTKNESNYYYLVNQYEKQIFLLKDSIEKGNQFKLENETLSELEKGYIRWNTLMKPRCGEHGSLEDFGLAIKDYYETLEQRLVSNENLSMSYDYFEFDEYLGPIGIPPTPRSGSRGSTGKGWVEDIFVDPENPNIIFAGTHHSGLWKTNDGGDSWVDMTKNYPLINGVINFSFDPNNENIIYVLTGARYPGDYADYSNGIFKTYDGGVTWDEVIVDVGGVYYPSIDKKIAPIKLLTHPSNSNGIVYLKTLLIKGSFQ